MKAGEQWERWVPSRVRKTDAVGVGESDHQATHQLQHRASFVRESSLHHCLTVGKNEWEREDKSLAGSCINDRGSLITSQFIARLNLDHGPRTWPLL